jgi:hypothetical protein
MFPFIAGGDDTTARLLSRVGTLALALARFGIHVALGAALSTAVAVSALAAGKAVPPLEAVAFADAAHGWAGGKGVVLATADGGKTWRRVYSGPAEVRSLFPLDANIVWAVGGLL